VGRLLKFRNISFKILYDTNENISQFFHFQAGANTMKGYMGKILFVDLTKGSCTEERLPDDIYYNYLCGTGLAVRLLYERIPANADPLGPNNVLAFMSGLLTGTGSLFTGRWMVAAKSPLTGTWGDANCGGNLAPAIKQCGYDGILFSGTGKEPVYLHIDSKGPELLPANGLWGTDAIETEKILISRSRSKKRPAVACIGSAGEKLSLISGICNDRGRIAARSGLGAVMGSKKLKAIVLEGKRPVRPANPLEMKRLSKICSRRSKGLPLPSGKFFKAAGTLMGKLKYVPPMNGKLIASLFSKWGTSSLNQFSVELGDSPVKNWKGSRKDYPARLSKHVNPDRVKEREKEKYHCYSCPMGCGGICSMKGGKGKEVHRPEYETTMSLGSMLLNCDLDSIFHINDMLNRAGMDTISAGGTVAFAMECFENGIITTKDTGGIELDWGNSDGAIALLEKMVKREGIGDIFADGAKAAAKRLGKESETYAITAGGQEMPMHDPRNDPGFGLHASVDPTPGRHCIGALQYYELYALWKRIKTLPRPKPLISVRSKFETGKEKAVCAVANSSFSQFYNGAGLCLFGVLTGVHRTPVFEWMNAATGWDRTPEDYMELGRRLQTLKQLFNIKHGIEPLSLKASARAVGEPPLKEGPNRGRSLDLEKMMKDYWQEIGWDRETGKPTAETIDALGLTIVVEGKKEQPAPLTTKKSPTPRRVSYKGKKPVIDKKRCVSCAACVEECPVTCLVLIRKPGKDPHPYPELPEPEKCISCAFCKEGCPVDAISMV
jgi:aldehyde:ferredoxin oxidoreductase